MPAHTVKTEHLFWDVIEGVGKYVSLGSDEVDRIQKIISVCLNNKIEWAVISDIVQVATDLKGEDLGIVLCAIKADWER